MAELKTRPTGASVRRFVDTLPDPERRRECRILMKLMARATGKRPRMWGESMIGYGRYHYRYASGREGDWFVTGLSPRKRNLVVYVMPGFERYQALMQQLGRHKTSVSCLYINRLEDIDLDVLEQIVKRSVGDMQAMYECQ